MFFFFPFYTESQPSSNGGGSSSAKALPLLPAPGASRTSDRSWDFGDFAMDLLRQTIQVFTSSLTALGNQANALFAQITAALAFDRVTRDSAAFLNNAWTGLLSPNARTAPFGLYHGQDPMSFSPFMLGNFNPWAMNPWAAFAEGMNFWTSLWMPAAPKRSTSSPFMAKVSTPGGFTWGFSWGQ